VTEEKFDVVNEKDEPTGQIVSKKEAHEKGYPHRVVAVLVFRENGRLMIQEHKLMRKLLDHSVGGHVSAGESYKSAVYREAKEELDLDVELEEIALSVPTKTKDPRPEFQNIIHFYGVYKANVPDNWVFSETEEVNSLLEMSLEEVVGMMNSNPDRFLNGFFITLTAYLKKIHSPLQINAYGQNWGEL